MIGDGETVTPLLPEPGVWTGMASADVWAPLRWKHAKIHRGSRQRIRRPHQEAGYTSAVVTVAPDPISVLQSGGISGRSDISRKPANARQAIKPKRRAASKVARDRRRSTRTQDGEVANLRRELAMALEQQTATSDVLKVISSSPGELEPVFAAMLEKATRICEAYFATLLLREGNAFRAVALHNAPPNYVEARKRDPLIHLTTATNPLARLPPSDSYKETFKVP